MQNKESAAVEHCNIAIEAMEKQLPEKSIIKTEKEVPHTITLEMFFEIKNAEMYGGEGSTGYAEIKEDVCLESMKEYDLQKDAEGKIEGFAKMLKVSKEDVRIISRTEYEENTEED